MGALYGSYNRIGAGLPEKYYQVAVRKEFSRSKIPFQEQAQVKISGLTCNKARLVLDFVVDGKIAVELKVGTRFRKKAIDQVMAYLRQSGLRLPKVQYVMDGDKGLQSLRVLGKMGS